MLKKSDGKKNKKKILNIDKLEDADKIGEESILILTEGDSAKTLAMAGISSLSEKEKKKFGVFALKGKLLNVREASMT